ncbi:MAG: hypothetical protein KDA74_19885, partial [Planctomycetaceae bacterium]|nr:hypothetical protein [Planctomycetaceae bacterium]
ENGIQPLLRIWDLQSLNSGKAGAEPIVVQISEPKFTQSMAAASPPATPKRSGFAPQPVKPAQPAELSADQKKQVEAFKAILKPDQSFAGKWTVAKLNGRIALKVVKGPTDDVYEVVLYDPSRVSETKSFEAAFVPDKDKLFLELTPIKGSGVDKTPSRVPKTYNLLLIPDMRTYRFILDKTTLIGMDTLGINYQLFQQ